MDVSASSYFLPRHPPLLLLLLCHVAVGFGRPTADHGQISMHPDASYMPSLPRSLLDRAKSYIGDEARMKRFTAKLVEGQPVKVTV